MNTRLNLKVAVLACVLCIYTPGASAAVGVSVGVNIHATADFYEPLAAHGGWVEIGAYGRCWRPNRVIVGWRPYCDGHWEWTDCGWYWVSDEPWAWACYHYGSWVLDSAYGWVWVPGLEWAPAWVYWRVGGGHIGWAPCGPRGVVVVPSQFVFVEAGHFHERIRPSSVVVNNTTIINQTTEINAVRRENRNFSGHAQTVVINEGPGVDIVRKATGRKFEPVSVVQADRATPAPKAMKEPRNEIAPPAGVARPDHGAAPGKDSPLPPPDGSNARGDDNQLNKDNDKSKNPGKHHGKPKDKGGRGEP